MMMISTMRIMLMIKMTMLELSPRLERESPEDTMLVKKVGRIFSGPAQTMENMYNLIHSNGIPVHFVDREFMDNPRNKSVTETLRGVQIRCEDFGFDNWKTVYSPVGYILKADAILSYLREKIREAAVEYPDSVQLFENSSVCKGGFLEFLRPCKNISNPR